ncbi:MAG: hypothetical protein QM714_17070 [Nocardioides sp.]|uniref:hypothetical protein n=1 Tax=Nocardioides sp. TaxID=35761 RepID=UPI0039E2A461
MPAAPEEKPLPQLSSYADHLHRHWLVLLVTTILGALIGSAIYFSMPQRYLASSRVAVSPQITYLSLNTQNEKQSLVTLDTTAALLRSDGALDKISTAMGVSPDQASDSLTISAKPGSRVLILQIAGDSRRQAVAGANAATEQLLSLQSHTFALSSSQVRLLKKRVNVLRRQALDQIDQGAPAQSLLQTVSILQTRLDKAIDTNNTTSAVIMRAHVVQYRPGQLEVLVASGISLGLLGGLGLTLLPRPRRPRRRTGTAAQRARPRFHIGRTDPTPTGMISSRSAAVQPAGRWLWVGLGTRQTSATTHDANPGEAR